MGLRIGELGGVLCRLGEGRKRALEGYGVGCMRGLRGRYRMMRMEVMGLDEQAVERGAEKENMHIVWLEAYGERLLILWKQFERSLADCSVYISKPAKVVNLI
jgi:hypothetical protein